MPVNGLPTMLEVIISSLLKESTLSSYKIASNQHRSTLVLRFDSPRDLAMSENNNLEPVSGFRRKSPNQNNKDKQQQKQRKESSQPVERKSQGSTSEIQNQKGTDNFDAVDSLSSKRDKSRALSPSSSVFGQNTRPSVSVTDNRQLSTHTSSDQVSTLSTSTTDLSPDFVKMPISSISSKSIQQRGLFDKQFNDFLDCDRISQVCKESTIETKRRIAQVDRNNKFTKLLLDQHCSPPVIVAETKDMIIEYNMKGRKISNFMIKDNQYECQRKKMRLRHVQTWRDESDYLQHECYDDYLRVTSALTQLKLWIDLSITA